MLLWPPPRGRRRRTGKTASRKGLYHSRRKARGEQEPERKKNTRQERDLRSRHIRGFVELWSSQTGQEGFNLISPSSLSMTAAAPETTSGRCTSLSQAIFGFKVQVPARFQGLDLAFRALGIARQTMWQRFSRSLLLPPIRLRVDARVDWTAKQRQCRGADN